MGHLPFTTNNLRDEGHAAGIDALPHCGNYPTCHKCFALDGQIADKCRYATMGHLRLSPTICTMKATPPKMPFAPWGHLPFTTNNLRDEGHAARIDALPHCGNYPHGFT